MEEDKKFLIIRILLIFAAILLIINNIPDLISSSKFNLITVILYPVIAIVLIIICIKINDIPSREYLILILGIVIFVLGILFNTDMGLLGIIIAAILVIIAGLLDLAVKS